MLAFLKWFFSNSGIQYTTQPPHRLVVLGRQLVYLNPLPGVEYRPNGLTASDIMKWRKWGRVFSQYKCRFCGMVVWAYKNVKVCGGFSCFRKNGGRWK